MNYNDFEQIVSQPRLNRYLAAVANDRRRAQTLYRKNVALSQELFAVVSYFEIALRNAINDHYVVNLGPHWLRDSIQIGGRFDAHQFRYTKKVIETEYNALGATYTHPRLVAKLNFGFWRFMFANHQYSACGSTLISIFPNMPPTTMTFARNASSVVRELVKINTLRNKIAHHDPVIFRVAVPVIDTYFANLRHQNLLQLFQWMNINSSEYLFGIDHVQRAITDVNNV
jgi:hypothetical protein